jgi:hypothetical protein
VQTFAFLSQSCEVRDAEFDEKFLDWIETDADFDSIRKRYSFEYRQWLAKYRAYDPEQATRDAWVGSFAELATRADAASRTWSSRGLLRLSIAATAGAGARKTYERELKWLHAEVDCLTALHDWGDNAASNDARSRFGAATPDPGDAAGPPLISDGRPHLLVSGVPGAIADDAEHVWKGGVTEPAARARAVAVVIARGLVDQVQSGRTGRTPDLVHSTGIAFTNFWRALAAWAMEPRSEEGPAAVERAVKALEQLPKR